MNPTPRKLALAMSIAGFGASLAGTAHARSETEATRQAWMTEVVGLPVPALAAGSGDRGVLVEGLPPVLAALPLDRVLTAVGAPDAATTKRRPACAPLRGAAAAIATPRSLWGARRVVAEASASTAVGLTPTADVLPDAPPCRSASLRDEPAVDPGAEDVGGRPSEALPATRPWELASSPGDDPDAVPLAAGHALTAAQRELSAPPTNAGIDAGPSGADATAEAATPADKVREMLALHQRAPLSAESLYSSERPSAQVDIDIDVDIDLDLDLDRPAEADPAPFSMQAPVTVSDEAHEVELRMAHVDPHPASVVEPAARPVESFDRVSAPATTGVDIDLDLDLDLDFYLRSIAAPDSAAAVDTSAGQSLDIDLGLPDLGLGEPGAGLPEARRAAALPTATAQASRAAGSVSAGSPLARPGTQASCRTPEALAEASLPTFPGMHDDTFLGRLDPLVSPAEALAGGLVAPADDKRRIAVAASGAAVPAAVPQVTSRHVAVRRDIGLRGCTFDRPRHGGLGTGSAA